MNPSDVSALNDAIKELTKALKGGGDSGGSTPGYRPDSPTGELNPLGIVDQRVKALQKEKDFAQDVLDLKILTREQETNLLKELEKKGDARSEQEEKMFGILQLQGESREQFYETSEQIVESSDKLLEIETKQIKIQAELVEQRKAAAEYTENMVMSFGQMIGMKAPKKGGIVDVISSLTSSDKATRQKALEGIAKGLKSMFSPVNMATNLLEKLGELFVYLFMKGDLVGATFARITGQGRELASASTAVAQSFGNVAAKSADLAKGAADAQNALAGVAGMSRIQASQFGGLSLALERVGVSSTDMASIVSQNMVGMGMTARESAQTFANLQEAANQMGMQFGELASSFASSQGSFAAFGHNMTKVFLRTQSTARQLGVELGTLVELGEKFDTFESAAASVADLNYIMGGQFLDTMEMMAIQAEEGPEGVARAIKEQMDATGKNFEDFSYHQRKAMSQALGMSTGEAQKFLSGAIDDTAVDAVEAATAPMDKLFKKSNQTLDVLDRLAITMEGLATNLGKGLFGEDFVGMTRSIEKSLSLLSSKETMDAVKTIAEHFRNVANSAFSMNGLLGGTFGLFQMLMAGVNAVATEGANISKGLFALLVRLPERFMSALTALGSFLKNSFIFKALGRLAGVLNILTFGSDLYDSVAKQDPRALMKMAGGAIGAGITIVGGTATTGVGGALAAGAGYGVGSGLVELGLAAYDKIKGFAPGTDRMTRGGLALVGEKGPEIVTVPPGAGVIPNDAFARGNGPFTGNNIASDSRDVTVHVKLDVNDRKFREMITLNTVDVIEGRGVLA